MNYNDELLKDKRVLDGRKSLPHHATKKWSQRDASKIVGVVFHQSLEAYGQASGVSKYHVGPNHISADGLPGLSYTIFVERSGVPIMANSVEDKTLSQGNADLPGDENEMYLGICFGGNFSGPGYVGTQVPNSEQMSTASYLWQTCKRLWGLKNNQLFGHYDFGKPACPGYELMKFIEAINEDVDWAGEKYNLNTVPGRQKALKQLGYYAGEAVGDWSVECRAALTAFQKKVGLTPDGVWGKKTTAAVIAALG